MHDEHLIAEPLIEVAYRKGYRNLPEDTILPGIAVHNITGVHKVDPYSKLLAESIRHLVGTYAIDLTCGSGAHALILAKNFTRVIAVDLSYNAVDLTRKNATLNRVADRILPIQGNLFSSIVPDMRFDTIVAWPPVMPTPKLVSDSVKDDINDGGIDGRVVFDRILHELPNRLAAGGSYWTIHPWYLDLQRTRIILSKLRLSLKKIRAAEFPLGEISAKRLPYIRELGIVPPVTNGRIVQQMSIIMITRSSGNERLPNSIA